MRAQQQQQHPQRQQGQQRKQKKRAIDNKKPVAPDVIEAIHALDASLFARLRQRHEMRPEHVLAPDAIATIRSAVSLLEGKADGAIVSVPMCPYGVKHRDVVALALRKGLHCVRMGTGATRTLLVSRRPFVLRFGDLSFGAHAFLSRHAGLRLFDRPLGTDSSSAGRDDAFITLPHVDPMMWKRIVTDVIVELGGENRFLDMHRHIVEHIGIHLGAHKAFERWQAEPARSVPRPRFAPSTIYGFEPTKTAPHPPKTIYDVRNDGRCFVTIDLVTANFQVLKRCAGLFEQDTWAAFVAQQAVCGSLPNATSDTPLAGAGVNETTVVNPATVAYVARAKCLRMMALSHPHLRPDLQQALWSQTVLDALQHLLDAGACTEADVAMWNSDEVIFHAADADDARAKCAAFAQIIESAMPDWHDAFEYGAFRIDALAPPIAPGFVRTCLLTNKQTFRCTDVARLQATAALWSSAPLGTLCANHLKRQQDSLGLFSESSGEDAREQRLLAMLNLDREGDVDTIARLKSNAQKCNQLWLDYLEWLSGVVADKEAEGVLASVLSGHQSPRLAVDCASSAALGPTPTTSSSTSEAVATVETSGEPIGSTCLARIDNWETQLCDGVTAWILCDPLVRRHGASMSDIVLYMVERGVEVGRAQSLALYIVDHRARALLACVPGDKDTQAKGPWRIYAAWEWQARVATPPVDWTQETDAYRRRAWPEIDDGTSQGYGPQSGILPADTCLVDTVAECARVSRLLAREKVIAIDCEGIMSEHIELGLVQIHAPNHPVYLFDTLAPEARGGDAFFAGVGEDSLEPVLRSQTIVKVVHAVRGDATALHARYGCRLAQVFDTQIAYAVAMETPVNRASASLNQVLQAYAESGPSEGGSGGSAATITVNPDKDAVSRAVARDRWCWHRRPLTTRLARYAAADVRHLVALYERIVSSLGEERALSVATLSAHRVADALALLTTVSDDAPPSS